MTGQKYDCMRLVEFYFAGQDLDKAFMFDDDEIADRIQRKCHDSGMTDFGHNAFRDTVNKVRTKWIRDRNSTEDGLALRNIQNALDSMEDLIRQVIDHASPFDHDVGSWNQTHASAIDGWNHVKARLEEINSNDPPMPKFDFDQSAFKVFAQGLNEADQLVSKVQCQAPYNDGLGATFIRGYQKGFADCVTAARQVIRSRVEGLNINDD
jgi:hypothetical protein